MRQLRRLGDRVARFTQSANCSMLRGVRFASAVLVRGSCYFDALALPFASHLVIVIRDLQRDFKQHLLECIQNKFTYALRAGRQFRKVDDAGYGKAGAFGPDSRNQFLGFFEWQSADAINVFCNNNLADLKVVDHT